MLTLYFSNSEEPLFYHLDILIMMEDAILKENQFILVIKNGYSY